MAPPIKASSSMYSSAPLPLRLLCGWLLALPPRFSGGVTGVTVPAAEIHFVVLFIGRVAQARVSAAL